MGKHPEEATMPKKRKQHPSPPSVAALVRARLSEDMSRTGVAWWPLGRGYIADPYPALRRLREADPCHRSVLAGHFLVSRYRDVDRILRDHKRFRNSGCRRSSDTPTSIRPMHFTDPPTHTHLRRLANRAFSARDQAKMEDYIRTTAHELLDQAVGGGRTFDLMSMFAVPLPVRVVGRMVGWPSRDFAILQEWLHRRALAADGSDGAVMRAMQKAGFPLVLANAKVDREALRDMIPVEMRFRNFLAQLVEQRQAEPRDDVVSRLVHAGSEDASSTFARRNDIMLQMLLEIGNATTTNLIGNGLLALLRHPEQNAVAAPAFQPSPGRGGRAVEVRRTGPCGSARLLRGRRNRRAARSVRRSCGLAPGRRQPRSRQVRPARRTGLDPPRQTPCLLRARHPPLSGRPAGETARPNRLRGLAGAIRRHPLGRPTADIQAQSHIARPRALGGSRGATASGLPEDTIGKVFSATQRLKDSSPLHLAHLFGQGRPQPASAFSGAAAASPAPYSAALKRMRKFPKGWPRHCGRIPSNTTRPSPRATSKAAAFPCRRSSPSR